MERGWWHYLGLFTLLIGITLGLFSGLELTGFAVLSESIKITWRIVSLVLIAGGVFLFLGGDALQDYLAEKELVSPSPSLKSSSKQSFGEKFHFKRRKIFGVKKISQKNESTPLEEISLSPSPNKRADEFHRKNINYARQRISQQKKRMDEYLAGQNTHFYPDMDSITGDLSRIQSSYRDSKMTFSPEKYFALFRKKGEQGIEESGRRILKRISENGSPITETEISNMVRELNAWYDLAGKPKIDKKKTAQNLRDFYARKAKTIPVSEVEQKYGVKLAHGLPLRTSAGIYPLHLNVNNETWSRDNPNKYSLEDFVDFLLNKKHDVSAFGVRSNSSPEEFFSPVGVIFREGKIYDASQGDMASIASAEDKNVRIRLGGGGGEASRRDSNLDLATRIKNASLNKPIDRHNEFILGDNSEVGGLYFVEGGNWDSRQGVYNSDVVSEIAQVAIKKNLPLYSFKEGRGFEKVDPLKYLPK